MLLNMMLYGLIGGLIGGAIVEAVIFVVKYTISKTDTHIKEERRLQQLSNDLSKFGLLKMQATDNYNLVSQYYGKEDDTKLNINNL